MAATRRSVDLSETPDLVVIYLGYRVQNLRAARTLLRIAPGLSRIQRDPPDGLLAHETVMFGLLHPGFRQYWRDFESLEAFTRAPQHAAWWRLMTQNPDAGGIWHETYRLRGGMEAIYVGCPAFGLASFAPNRTAIGTARERLNA